MAWQATRCIGLVIVALLAKGFTASAPAEESRFAQTGSRSQYVHWIHLHDAKGRRIDPTEPGALPYSPAHTCGSCHDYEAIAHGHHFNAMHQDMASGRPGEPWIWTDTRTGTQIPISYRGWKGTYTPDQLGIAPWDFVMKFGRHLPGGGPGEAGTQTEEQSADSPPAEPAEEAAADTAAEDKTEAEAEEPANRWGLSGQLVIDCMMCHSNDHSYSPEVWWGEIEKQNFAWASAAAQGLAQVEGMVSSLPDDYDPEAATDEQPSKLPKTTYVQHRVNPEKKMFFDVIHTPSNNVCYYCHTTRPAGGKSGPDWNHDEDVHLRAGMSCSDCHRNGIQHHTVRGYENEQHPTGESVATLSCRGCHMDSHAEGTDQFGGRLGATKPMHKGLPPLHLERLSCTACHSGPQPGSQAEPLQTALAHGLGLPSHHLSADLEPGIVAPVLLQDEGVLYPHRMVWPAFWGKRQGDEITPLNPDAVQDTLRRTLRVRRGSTFTETMLAEKLSSDEKTETLGEERAKVAEEELTDEEKEKLATAQRAKAMGAFREKLAEALGELKEIIAEPDAQPVYVSGGKGYGLGEEDALQEFAHATAAPYAWKLAHDVRPARWASGVQGCTECHSAGSPIFEGTVTAIGPAPDDAPMVQARHELAGFDKTKLDAWNQSFQGRTAFKYLGFGCLGAVGLILLAYVLLGIQGLVALVRGR